MPTPAHTPISFLEGSGWYKRSPDDKYLNLKEFVLLLGLLRTSPEAMNTATLSANFEA